MEIQVLVTKTYEETCTLVVEDMDDARRQIAALTNDDFRESESYYEVIVTNEQGENISGEIQVSPKIGL